MPQRPKNSTLGLLPQIASSFNCPERLFPAARSTQYEASYAKHGHHGNRCCSQQKGTRLGDSR